MRLSALILLFILVGQLGIVTLAQSGPTKPTYESLSKATIQFKPVTQEGLPLSPKAMFLGYPFCSADGTTFLTAVLPSSYSQQVLVGVTRKGKLSKYYLTNVPGLVNVQVLSVDVRGTDIYALIKAEKSEVLLNNDINPGSSSPFAASRYAQYFIEHVTNNLSAPEVKALDLPFLPVRLSVLDKDELALWGIDTTSQNPVIALVDDSGQSLREIDTNGSFGSTSGLLANAPAQIKDQIQALPVDSQMSAVMSAAQVIHQGDSLLFLVPGSKARIVTLRRSGEVKSTMLHLPLGLEADSLVSSDKNWFVRVSSGLTASSNDLLMIDPVSGEVTQVFQLEGLSPDDVTCIHDNTYFGVHWSGKPGNKKLYLMSGSEQ